MCFQVNCRKREKLLCLMLSVLESLRFIMIINCNLVITACTLYVYIAVFAFFLLIYRTVEGDNNVKVSLQQTYHYWDWLDHPRLEVVVPFSFYVAAFYSLNIYALNNDWFSYKIKAKTSRVSNCSNTWDQLTPCRYQGVNSLEIFTNNHSHNNLP